jgi:glyoxylase-like metal-dependent hydrolase (beta-lactamase superfamily II)
MRRVALLAALLAVLAAPVVLFALFIRRMRRRRPLASEPRQVHAGVVHVRNAFTDLYAARAGSDVLVFDAGFDPAGRALGVLLSALSAGFDDVSDVFLSHGHFDHVAAAPLCRHARIHTGAADVEMLAHRTRVIPLGVRIFDRALPVPAVETTHPLRGRTVIPLQDGRSVTAIPFPGHTAGSYLMLFDGVLFAGDSLRIVDGRLELALLPFSVNLAENRRSAARILELLEGAHVEVVCTGHQGCTPPGEAMAMLEDLRGRTED